MITGLALLAVGVLHQQRPQSLSAQNMNNHAI